MSFWVWSQFTFLSFVTIWILEFCHFFEFLSCQNLPLHTAPLLNNINWISNSFQPWNIGLHLGLLVWKKKRKEGEVWKKNGPDWWVFGIVSLPHRNRFNSYFGIIPPPGSIIPMNSILFLHTKFISTQQSLFKKKDFYCNRDFSQSIKVKFRGVLTLPPIVSGCQQMANPCTLFCQ